MRHVIVVLSILFTGGFAQAEEDLNGYCENSYVEVMLNYLKGKDVISTKASKNTHLPSDTLSLETMETIPYGEVGYGITTITYETRWKGRSGEAATHSLDKYRITTTFGLNGGKCFLVHLSESKMD